VHVLIPCVTSAESLSFSPGQLPASLPSSANEPPLVEEAPADAGLAARSAVPHAARFAVPQRPNRSFLELLERELETDD
jgi:hypothetical protein